MTTLVNPLEKHVRWLGEPVVSYQHLLDALYKDLRYFAGNRESQIEINPSLEEKIAKIRKDIYAVEELEANRIKKRLEADALYNQKPSPQETFEQLKALLDEYNSKHGSASCSDR